MVGYISIHRQIFDNHLWKEKPFDRARAWIDLILLANHKPQKVIIKGIVFDLKRGQLAWSMKSLAERWGWSRGKVKRFLEMLENEHQIEHQNNNITTCVSILNYDKFQSTDTKTDIKRTSNGHQTDTDNKDNNDNKIISSRFSPPTIDDVSAYFEQRGVSEDISRKESSKFINHYQSVGWSVGKSKMKDWRAAVRGWIDRGELIKEKQKIKTTFLEM